MRSLSLVILMGLLFGALELLPEIVTPVPGIELTAEELRAFRERLEAQEVRAQTIEDLMSGRRTLAETAEQFRVIAVKQPDVMHHLRLYYPGYSDEQLIHRQILAYAQHWLQVRGPDLSPLGELKKEVEILEGSEDLHIPRSEEGPVTK